MSTVLALTKYGDRAASTRQRFLQHAPYLRHAGIELDVAPLLDNAYLDAIFSNRKPDLGRIAAAFVGRLSRLLRRPRHRAIWVHCEVFPYLPGPFERLVKLSGLPVIYDCDDAIFHQYDAHASPIVRRLLGRKLEPLLAVTEVAFCGNAYLAQWARRHCRSAEIIPTVVDVDRYRPADGPPADGATIGWIGSPSTWKFVKPIVPVLQDLSKDRGIRVRVVGAGAEARGVPGIESLDWSEEREIPLVQGMDVGVMPLDTSPFARGKCGYKLIQYMACGLPVVASPVGVNSEIVDHGVNGFLAATDDEWREALRTLLRDRDLRQRMGRAAREKIERGYSLQVHGPRVARLVGDLVGQGGPVAGGRAAEPAGRPG